MEFGFHLASLTFSGGQVVPLPRVGVVLIVGPNNSGKSRSLRDIMTTLRAGEPQNQLVVTSVKEERKGGTDRFWQWLKERYLAIGRDDSTTSHIVGAGFEISSNALRSVADEDWGRTSGFGNFALSLVSYLDTSARLSAADPANSYDAVNAHPTLPLQVLYADGDRESRLSAAFAAAFGEDLVVDRHGGNQITLRCGKAPNAASEGGHLSLSYAKKVRGLPSLHIQGDGMRSFVACLLHTEILRRPVVLIDEPEAFLHPPQARQLAYHLATSAKETNSQVLVSTHSADIVRGVLEAGTEVAVIRLERYATENHASQLDSTSVSEFWNDPLLRSSNLLDGLFHKCVVICEADSDCRFYSTILDLVCQLDGRRRPEVFFSYTGGKDRLATAVRALRAIQVPVIVIADLDFLFEDHSLQKIWATLGRRWEEIERDWKIVKAAVDSTERNPSVAYVRDALSEILDESKNPLLDKRAAKRVRELVRVEGGWRAVKHGGLDAIPKGDARASCDRLIAVLKAGGLHLVPVGELEGFVPGIGDHGPGWLEEALKLDLASSAPRAIEFVRGLPI